MLKYANVDKEFEKWGLGTSYVNSLAISNPFEYMNKLLVHSSMT